MELAESKRLKKKETPIIEMKTVNKQTSKVSAIITSCVYSQNKKESFISVPNLIAVSTKDLSLSSLENIIVKFSAAST